MEVKDASYERNRRSGEPEVHYSCPRCRTPLVSTMQDFQGGETCPACGVSLTLSQDSEALVKNLYAKDLEQEACLLAEKEYAQRESRSAKEKAKAERQKKIAGAMGEVRKARKKILVAIACIAGVGVWCGVIAAIYYFREHVQAVVAEATQVVADAKASVVGRTISPAEVRDVLSRTSVNDISSQNVNQQLATYARGVMQMAELVALAFGANEGAAAGEISSAAFGEIQSNTVFQQKTVFYKAAFRLLHVGAQACGADESACNEILSAVEIGDIRADTVHQQCANYCQGMFECAALIAACQGGDLDDLQGVRSGTTTSEIGADTVFQQIVCRLKGLVSMLEIVANQRGAEGSDVGDVLHELRLADISSETVYQQEVNCLIAVMKLLGLVAIGG